MKTKLITPFLLLLYPRFLSTASGQVDSWADNTRGFFKWETAAEWSLDVTPSLAQTDIMITNRFGNGSFARTVNIDAITVLSNAINGCMTINNLTLSSPSPTLNNNLLVNSTGATPLTIDHSLTISSHGVVVITNSVVYVGTAGGTLSNDGSLLLNTGTLDTGGVGGGDTSIVGNTGVGQMTVLDGTWLAGTVLVGNAAGSQGTLTLGGGTTVVMNGFAVGYQPGAMGAVWLTGGQLVISSSVVSVGSGQMTVSNGLVQSAEIDIAFYTGSAGTLTVAGGVVVGSNPDFGIIEVGAPGATGTVWVTGGQLLLTNVTAIEELLLLGEGGEGSLVESNGLVNVLQEMVGEYSQGTLTVAGGTNSATQKLLIGDQTGSTGAVWVTGGQLIIGDGGVTVGASGVGQMTVSNGTVHVSGEETVASAVGGTLTLAGGTHIIDSPLVIGGPYGGTGTVWVTGGQLLLTNGVLGIVSLLRGSQMTVSNGAVQMFTGLVGNSSGVAGTLTLAGGVTSIYSNLTLGLGLCSGSGFVDMSGGELHVTNHNSNSELDILDGTFIMTGGLLDVDRLVITNPCGHFMKLGGTLITGVVILDPNMDADGDGMPNGYEQANGFDPLDPTGDNGPDADLDGDGFTNLQEYLAGTDPHNAKSNLHITAVAREGNNLRVTWTTVGGKNYRILVTAGGPGGSFSNNFGNISSIITMPGVGESTTNYLDVGGATNKPARYYQVHLVP